MNKEYSDHDSYWEQAPRNVWGDHSNIADEERYSKGNEDHQVDIELFL